MPHQDIDDRTEAQPARGHHELQAVGITIGAKPKRRRKPGVKTRLRSLAAAGYVPASIRPDTGEIILKPKDAPVHEADGAGNTWDEIL